MSIQKFVPTSGHGGMVAVVSNDYSNTYVQYEDYAALQAKLDALREAAAHADVQYHLLLGKYDALDGKLDAVTKERDALRSALNPQNWTSEMSTAWHLNIPDLQKAFEELTKAALTDQGRAGEEL